jgi:hypothetical protein
MAQLSPGSLRAICFLGSFTHPHAYSRLFTPMPAIASCWMRDMLASSNTWLAPATAYCREATRETVNQFAQGSGARQSKGGDRHRHQISARPYAHDSPPCGAVSFAAIVETHTSCMRISNYRHGTQRLSVCPRRQVRYPNVPALRRTSRPSGSTHVGIRIRRHRAPILPPCVTATCRTTSMSM